MRTVHNVHERSLAAPRAGVAHLLDGLASPDDALWPRDRWPAMRLHPRLAEGAAGGHGPIRYRVEHYAPGHAVRFRFVAPRGFLGTHAFELLEDGSGVRLRHTVELRLAGWARLTWPLVFHPLHDALLEDALDRAERASGSVPVTAARWSPRVRMLRWLLARRARRLALLVALLAACLAPEASQAQPARRAAAEGTSRDAGADGAPLIAFRMRDQFGREHRAASFAGRPLVVVGCDRGGSRYGAAWASAFREAAAAERSATVTISVATLRGVPRFLRRAATAHFPTDTARWSLLDWDGEFARAYAFADDACTIVGFDARGRVRRRVAVRELEPRIVQETLARLSAREEGAAR